MRNPDFLKELDEFKELIDELTIESIETLKPRIIEEHSEIEVIVKRGIYPDLVKEKCVVDGFLVEVDVYTKSKYSFKHNTNYHSNYYGLSLTVLTDKGNPDSTKALFLFWETIKKDINLSKFPNFKAPKFV